MPIFATGCRQDAAMPRQRHADATRLCCFTPATIDDAIFADVAILFAAMLYFNTLPC